MEAFDQLIGGCAPSLLRLAVMLTGSREDAEDLLQATLLQAHRHRRRLLGMAAPTAYLRKVMVNAHISSRRTESRRPRRIELDVVPELDALRASPTTKMSYVTGGVGLDSRATLVTGMRFHLATGEVSVRLETDGALVTVALSTPGTAGSSLDGGPLRGGFMTAVEKIVGLQGAS